MVSRAQLKQLRMRIEALAPPSKVDASAGARERFLQRIDRIGERLRADATERGEPWPTPISREEQAETIRRFRSEGQASGGSRHEWLIEAHPSNGSRRLPASRRVAAACR